MQYTFPPEALPMTIDEYLSRPGKPEESYLIEGIVPAGGKVNIYGQPKAGKSYLALGLALSVSGQHNSHFLSWPVLNHGSVLYVSLDSAPGEWEQLYIAPAKLSGLYRSGDPFYHVDASMAPNPFDLQDTRTRAKDWMIQAIHWVAERSGSPPTLVVIDVFRKIYWGDEDKSGVQLQVLSLLDACTPGIAKLISHHGKKPPEEGEHPLMAGGRGSNYLPGECSTVMAIVARENGRKAKLTFNGRGSGSGSLKLQRPGPFEVGSSNGFWELDLSNEVQALSKVLNDMKGQPVLAMARELNRLVPELSLDASRDRIRRALDLK